VSSHGPTGGGTTAGMVSEDQVRAALGEVCDPELPVDVVSLGLVRQVEVTGGTVRVGMTFTTLACPCTELLRADVRDRLLALDGVEEAMVEEVFEPWSRHDMTDEARALLRALAVV
jgi:metal-sulfur cluster biosynthetic enzyme